MSESYMPKQRAYVHKNCESTTIVADDMFSLICDPTQAVSGTFCTSCNDYFPLSQFVWADTNERIDRARERWWAEAPAGVRRIHSNLLIVIAIVLGTPLGAGFGWLLGGGQFSHVAIGAGVGAIVLACLWAAAIPLIMRNIFAWDWRRMR